MLRSYQEHIQDPGSEQSIGVLGFDIVAFDPKDLYEVCRSWGFRSKQGEYLGGSICQAVEAYLGC